MLNCCDLWKEDENEDENCYKWQGCADSKSFWPGNVVCLLNLLPETFLRYALLRGSVWGYGCSFVAENGFRAF